MRIINQVCPIYGCGYTYETLSEHTLCPKCGYSVFEVEHVGSNDPEVIRNFDWRMHFKTLMEKK